MAFSVTLPRAVGADGPVGPVGPAPTDEQVAAIIDPAIDEAVDEIASVAVIKVDSSDAATSASYASGLGVRVPVGQSNYLVMDPSQFTAQCDWASSQSVGQSGRLVLRVPDGFHDVTAYADITDGRTLDIEAVSAPTMVQITGATITSLGSNTYSAVVTVDAALPAVAVVGYPIGMFNCKGFDAGVLNAMGALNGAHTITMIAPDRLSFGFTFLCQGPALSSPLSVDNSSFNGALTNRVMVPRAAIRANSAGWDGGAREGFMNALSGGLINIRWVGLVYQGISSEHEMLFAGDEGSAIRINDYTVVCGAGDKVMRCGPRAQIYANRACIGGALTAEEAWQGVAGAQLHLNRCFTGSFKSRILSATVDTQIFTSQCTLTGGETGLLSTYVSSSITISNSHLWFTGTGAISAGSVWFQPDCTIRQTVTPYGVGTGRIISTAALSDNTNPPVTDLSAGFRTAINAGRFFAAGSGAQGVAVTVPANGEILLATVTATGATAPNYGGTVRSNIAAPAGVRFETRHTTTNQAQVWGINTTSADVSVSNRTYYVTMFNAP